jgi:adenylate cyclase
LARKAVTLDENDPICQTMLGWVYLHRGSFDLAERYYERALELNPNDAEQIAYMGVLNTYLGNPDGAVGWFGRARALDRYFEPSWYWPMLGVAHFTARRYDEAVAALHRSPTMPVWVRAYLAACHALAGRADRARELAANVVRSAAGFSSALLAAKEPFKRPADREALLKGLCDAGLPE